MTLLAAALPLRRFALPLAAALALAGRASAQTELTHTEDAAPIPRGLLRLRVIPGWTRYDQRYGIEGLAPLGVELSADPLGATQLPLLTPIQGSLQTLAADPQMKLSLGRLVTRSDARLVTTPIVMELGLTSRLSLGVVVPVVQTRRILAVEVNSATGTPANVGFVAEGKRSAAAQANAAAATAYNTVAAKLGTLINTCSANPSAPGCGAYNADPAGAAAARTRALAFASAAQGLGTSAAAALIAPRAGGTFAYEIELQRNALNAQLQRYLSASDVAPAVYFATTDFSYIDLQGRNGVPGLLQSDLAGGLDSIRTTNRTGFGDVAVGLQLQLFDHFQRDTLPLRGMQARMVVGGAVRLPTSRRDTVTNLADIGTGEGPGFEVRSALDLIVGRVGATVAGRYLSFLAREAYAPLYGDPDAAIPLPGFGLRDRKPGDMINLDVTPRYLLNESFAIDAHYGFERRAATTWAAPVTEAALPQPLCAIASCDAVAGVARSTQRVGLGLRYSTMDAWLRGRSRLPIEASYTHLSTISGDPGVLKLSREQIQVRIFYRLFGQ